MDDTLWGVNVEVVPAAGFVYDDPAPRSFSILNVNVVVAAAAPELCGHSPENGYFLIHQGTGVISCGVFYILDIVDGYDSREYFYNKINGV